MRGLLVEMWWDFRGSSRSVILSAVSLAIAIIALVGIITAASVSTDVVLAGSEQSTGRVATARVTLPPDLWTPDKIATATRLLDRLSANTGDVWLLTFAPNAVVSGPNSIQAVVTYYLGTPPAIRRLPLLEGEWPTGRPYPAVTVVNQTAAAQFGSVGAPLKLTADQRYGQVVLAIGAVIADGGSSPFVYVPLPTITALCPPAVDAVAPTLYLSNPSRGRPQLAADVLAAAGGLGYDTSTMEVGQVDTAEDSVAAIRMIAIAFEAVAGIALVVAAIGMVNIGLASMASRNRELTVRRAIGATSRRVIAVITLTTVLMGLVVTIVALVIAWIIVTRLVPVWLPPELAINRPAFPWAGAGIAAGLTLLASLVGGLVPAAATRKLTLSDALRE